MFAKGRKGTSHTHREEYTQTRAIWRAQFIHLLAAVTRCWLGLAISYNPPVGIPAPPPASGRTKSKQGRPKAAPKEHKAEPYRRSSPGPGMSYVHGGSPPDLVWVA
jgi:hypothetical protein